MSGQRILVIDDEVAMRRLLRVSLGAEGYVLVEAASGQEGLVAAATQRPELIVLDLGLADLDGLTVLRRLREWSTVPVIILTVKEAETDKVALLDAGADDYITKPFSVAELSARIRVALRHRQPSGLGPIFRTGSLEVNLADRQVRVHNQEAKLTTTEYEILRMLVLHAGKIVTQRQMLTEIWGPSAAEQTQYLRVYIAQLRKKLEDDPSRPKLIQTEPGVGYRLKIHEI